MARRPTVAFGFVGLVLDRSPKEGRGWDRWRPSVGLCQHEDLLIDRFELFHDDASHQLAEQVAIDIQSVSPETTVRLTAFAINNPWDFEEVYGTLHTFARNYPFSDDEDYLVHITTGTHVHQICFFLLTETRHFPARLVQTAPPRRKRDTEGTWQIIDLDLSRYDAIAMRFAEERDEAHSLLKSGIATRNERFNLQIEEIERVAIASRDPMLLTGPTGAGKSLLARRIFELKQKRRLLQGRFVEVNCATLRGDAAMSALFGHEKGAFTGAVAARNGLLRTADGGLLFLDEIGELGLDEQAMLLRALEERRFLPVGSDSEVESDFELIAGTNRDLHEAVRSGRFREDLLARIDTWTFALPSLRDRIEDLEPNLDYELEEFARRNGRRVGFNKEARARYLEFAMSERAIWSANFRDLDASVTRLATLAEGGRIRRDDVEREIRRLESGWRGTREDTDGDRRLLTELLGPEAFEGIDEFDRPQLAHVVRVCRQSNSLSDAGRRLFQASRLLKKSANDADRLRKYLRRFDLDYQALAIERG
ncbi:MAG: RNA repair transcriptional activator RtcR [Planctomycetes bacterium]|nr:RNA repair transcriptional activator RtcR [Planctomycetota bacterium]